MTNTKATNNALSVLDPTQALTGVDTRWSYVHLLEPWGMPGQEMRYSLTLLIPKSAVEIVKRINTAIREAYTKGLDKLKGKDAAAPALEVLPKILRDGDLEYPGDPAYAGCWFLRAKTTRKPKILDRNNDPIVDPGEVYSGCYGPVLVEFFAYNNISRGISCSLVAAWKFADGEPLGRSVDVNGVFAAIEGTAGENTNDFLR